MAALGPAPVAVHDDGHVLRKALQIEIFEEARFFAVGGLQEFGCFH